MSASADPQVLQGTAVALEGHGLLINGKPGSGKSSLALDLISRGAVLIADDRVLATSREDGLLMSAPDALAGLIEARGLGLLQMPHTSAPLIAVVDLDDIETERLPHAHETVMAGVTIPRLRKVESPIFPAMLVAYLRGGRRDV